MLTCIPTMGQAGLADTVCDHFGSAPFFTLYEKESGALTILANDSAHDGHGMCHPLKQLGQYKIEAFVCMGIGRRALMMLGSAGIKVYTPGTKSVAEVIEKIKTDALTELDPEQACQGHGQGPGGCGD